MKVFIFLLFSSFYTESYADSLISNKTLFPKKLPIGKFVATKTNPDLSSVPTNQYDASVFMPNQRVSFEYLGEVGSDWQGHHEYKMTLYPPYDIRMCEQDRWLFQCDEDSLGNLTMPAKPIHRIIYLITEKINNKNDLHELKEFIPHGLKINEFIYGGSSSDGGITYVGFYFKDWNTLISKTYYADVDLRNNNSQPRKFTTVFQTLKRIDEKARIPSSTMTK